MRPRYRVKLCTTTTTITDDATVSSLSPTQSWCRWCYSEFIVTEHNHGVDGVTVSSLSPTQSWCVDGVTVSSFLPTQSWCRCMVLQWVHCHQHNHGVDAWCYSQFILCSLIWAETLCGSIINKLLITMYFLPFLCLFINSNCYNKIIIEMAFQLLWSCK